MLGNLGSDGSGTVTEFVLEAPPFVGFVKRECSGAGARSADPSVNHLVVVDSSGGLPRHSCDYEQGSACTGASSDLDDDIVHDIAPGSPILYLLYSSESGYCIKEDEHRAIFDAAVRCLWADDPFAAVHRAHQDMGSQPLVEVDVSEVRQRGEIVFGGASSKCCSSTLILSCLIAVILMPTGRYCGLHGVATRWRPFNCGWSWRCEQRSFFLGRPVAGAGRFWSAICWKLVAGVPHSRHERGST